MKLQERANSFKELFRKYYPEAIQCALFYLRDLKQSEDVVQEVFTKLWEQCDKIQTIDNLHGYLLFSVKNSSLNYLKHQAVVDKFQQDYIYQAEQEEPLPEEYFDTIRRLVDKLPPKRREVLEMSIMESKSYQEIADSLDISVNTVKDHLKKAYSFLRKNSQKDIFEYILYFVLFVKKERAL